MSELFSMRGSASSNLNKILAERENAVKNEEIRQEVRKTLEKVVGSRTRWCVYVWPKDDRDVSDTSELSLVILDMNHPMGRGEEVEAATWRFISRILENHGAAPRKYRNTLIFLAPDALALSWVLRAARELIALQSVATDGVTVKQLSEEQRKTLYRRLNAARSRLPQVVGTAYRHVVVGGLEKHLEAWALNAWAYDRSRPLSWRVWDTLREERKPLER